MAGQKNKSKAVAEVPVEVAEEEAVTSEIVLVGNESVAERAAKRAAILEASSVVIAENLNAFVAEEFGLEIHVAVFPNRFDIEHDNGESFFAGAKDAITKYMREFDATHLLSDSSYTIFNGTVTLTWYEIASEYGSVENVEAQLAEWRKAHPTSINEAVVTAVAEELGLTVRIGTNSGGKEAFGNVDDVLHDVYLQIATLKDEDGRPIVPLLNSKPIPLASAKDDDNGIDWVVDLMHGLKRYASDEEFAAALSTAKARAATILANRYNETLSTSGRVVADDDDMDSIDDVPGIDDDSEG